MSTREDTAWLYRRVGFGLLPGQLDDLDRQGLAGSLDRLLEPDDHGVDAATDPWSALQAPPPDGANHRFANAAGNRSAPSTQLRTPGTAAGSRAPSNDGTTLATCTPESRIIACNNSGSPRSAPDAIANVPPAARVTTTSSTAASKENDANCNVVTPGPAPNTGRITSARFATPP